MSNKVLNICTELNIVIRNTNETVSSKQKELLHGFIDTLQNSNISLTDSDYLELLDLSKTMVQMNNNGKSILFWINRFMNNISSYKD